jgi:DNA-binding transcriptional LysR family regulator
MNMEPDWSLWRSFAAVVDAGSLSAAARKLGISQPTLGRHIETLERQLGIALFERTLSGFKPTALALSLYEPIAEAQRHIAEAQLRAAGAQRDPGGTVRITTSAVMAHYVLPAMLRPIREAYPGIAIEIVPSDAVENLLLREADIAIRLFRPTQLDLVTRKLGEIPIRTAAHDDYFDRHGEPQTPAELRDHTLIGFDRSDLIIRGGRQFGIEFQRSDFALRTDDQPLFWELMRAGLGIGFAQEMLITRTPGMRAILPQIALPPLEVWLTAHRELFTSRPIRAIYDALAEGVLSYLASKRVL